jgi:hypothetical protein
MLKFATRAVCDNPHGPWGVLTHDSRASTDGKSPRQVPAEGETKPPRPFGDFAGSLRAPWHTQIATESPFKAKNNGAYSRCEI